MPSAAPRRQRASQQARGVDEDEREARTIMKRQYTAPIYIALARCYIYAAEMRESKRAAGAAAILGRRAGSDVMVDETGCRWRGAMVFI